MLITIPPIVINTGDETIYSSTTTLPQGPRIPAETRVRKMGSSGRCYRSERSCMPRCLVLLPFALLVFFFSGCSPAFYQPRQPGDDYRLEIENWQERIRREGWNDAMVDEVMAKCIELSKYKSDPDQSDHWMTYKEFLQTFQGDCEDIATFMYGTLRRLDYPQPMRLRALRMPLGDHVVVMVQLPGGRWKMFNSVPIPGDVIDLAFSRTLVEWDEEKIYYPR